MFLRGCTKMLAVVQEPQFRAQFQKYFGPVCETLPIWAVRTGLAWRVTKVPLEFLRLKRPWRFWGRLKFLSRVNASFPTAVRKAPLTALSSILPVLSIQKLKWSISSVIRQPNLKVEVFQIWVRSARFASVMFLTQGETQPLTKFETFLLFWGNYKTLKQNVQIRY